MKIIIVFLSLLASAQAQLLAVGVKQAVTSVTIIGSCPNSAGSARAVACTASAGGSSGDLVTAFSKIGNTSGTASLAITAPQCGSGLASDWFWLVPVDANGTSAAENSGMLGCFLTSSATPVVTATWTGSTGTVPQLSVNVLHSSVGWNTPVLDRSVSSAPGTSTTNCATGSTTATNNPNDYIYVTCATNGTKTFNALSSFTTLTSSNANSLGNWGQLVSTTGVQSYTPTFNTATQSTGAVVALQLNTGLTCTGCTYVQGTSSSQTVTFDHLTISGTHPGDTLFYFVPHSNYSGTGTITMTDASGGLNIWHDCNEGVGPATSITVNDTTHLSATTSMHCFWTPVLLGTTVIGQPTATDCAANCTFVGSVLIEVSGTFNLDSFATSASGATSSAGSNNASCGAMTTTRANDLIINYIYGPALGTITAGTSPITFTLGSLATQANGIAETAVWTGSGSITPKITVANSSAAYGDICLALY